MGHEYAGDVEAVGGEVTTVKPDERRAIKTLLQV
jgi:Zn-dependent alcohol dehydrogenase